MTRLEIIEKVKEKLDEVQAYDAYQTGGVNLIDKLLDEAGETILNTVPLHTIPPEDFSTETHEMFTDGTGFVHLPDDFLRLSSFKLAEWDRPVTQPISKSNPLYNLQKNDVTRGKPSKPVCVIGYYQSGSGTGDPDDVTTPSFVTNLFFEGAYGWSTAPTNSQIIAIAGAASDYVAGSTITLHDTLGLIYYALSDGTIWNVNAASFDPAA